MTVVLVKMIILISKPLIGISLQLAGPRQRCIVLDLHQDLIDKGSQRGEVRKSSNGGFEVSILPSILILVVFCPLSCHVSFCLFLFLGFSSQASNASFIFMYLVTQYSTSNMVFRSFLYKKNKNFPFHNPVVN